MDVPTFAPKANVIKLTFSDTIVRYLNIQKE